MDTQDALKLSTLAERLGWSLRVSNGPHMIDLLLHGSATDLISVLAESKER